MTRNHVRRMVGFVSVVDRGTLKLRDMESAGKAEYGKPLANTNGCRKLLCNWSIVITWDTSHTAGRKLDQSD